jgi:hypothetical protein
MRMSEKEKFPLAIWYKATHLGWGLSQSQMPIRPAVPWPLSKDFSLERLLIYVS